MRTHPAVGHLAAAGITAAASIMTGLATGTAHADATTNGMTIQGSNFQVGQTYTVTVPTTATYAQQPLKDTWSSATVTVPNPAAVGTNGFTTFQWTPTTPGTHQLSTDPVPGLSNGTGPLTVQVSGTGSTDPSTCGFPVAGAADYSCVTLHGTLQVGCTVTATVHLAPSATPADPLGPVSAAGSALLGHPQYSIGMNDGASYAVAQATVNGNSATMTWTPTTAGVHDLNAWIQDNSIFAGAAAPKSAGEIWAHIAPSGTAATCA
ncbi:hypothetical protein [Nocardia stercoris]|uniref:Bacterial Ig-like domain-containing protein n=1 Tax=Nocardia stercoris TaxID=2483361 RepID=A0A3M2KXH7_9NOCA|nr:hypothetical protein [Nocardia stercoris]RMI29951.1 hypothetical protein EBN03_24515 [Nocardia stercoris]